VGVALPIVQAPLTDAPFVHTLRVAWGDCDAAFIAYTGRIPDFALQAIDVWWTHHIGLDWFRLSVDHGISTPFVHLEVDFRSPVTPRHPLQCAVDLVKLGNSSVTFAVRGLQDTRLCFESRFVCVFVETKTLSKIPIPPEIRTAVAHLVRAD
jgi:4-hydroxybenzoyl-CoA thioesterase